MPPIRPVLVLAVEGAESLDILGPVEVFDYADRRVPGSYRIDVVGPATDGQITMGNGLRLGVGPLPEPPPRPHTLVVAGGAGARRATADPAIVDWIARASRRARRTTSVCTGSYLLAAAGLLDGRRATTHWDFCTALAERYPAVEIDPDPVWVRDGDIWTSAGVTAGIDLALALVEDDLGAQVALAVARELVVFLKRPGGQSQFSGALSARAA
jgi:transcriptional regulator GlxA family with amidase domain